MFYNPNYYPFPIFTSHGWGRSNDLGLWLSKGVILIYHPVIDNQLVELYLICHRVPLYKVWAAPVWGSVIPPSFTFISIAWQVQLIRTPKPTRHSKEPTKKYPTTKNRTFLLISIWDDNTIICESYRVAYF